MGILEQKSVGSDVKMSTSRFDRIFQTKDEERSVKLTGEEKLYKHNFREKNV